MSDVEKLYNLTEGLRIEGSTHASFTLSYYGSESRQEEGWALLLSGRSSKGDQTLYVNHPRTRLNQLSKLTPFDFYPQEKNTIRELEKDNAKRS